MACAGDHRRWLRGPAIGRGSTATVFLAATAADPPETFAVKSAELSRSAPLRREQAILSSLSSPHVVAFLGADVETAPDGAAFYNLFMEYVPGGTLAEEIERRGGMEEGDIRWYTRGVLRGLAYLHSVGIAHCDVKGHNILVGAGDGGGDGCVKLADFGCSRRVVGGSDDVGTGGVGVVGGTPLYMAPEVARGEEQGTAADIWALGCTVVEMATGRPPWADVADPVAAIHRVAFSDDVPELPCNVSDEGRDWLGRCLRRDPGERWSAEELLSHPFLNRDVESTMGCRPEGEKKGSPRSTLEQGFWDSWMADDQEDDVAGSAHPGDEASPPESPEERLRRLTGGSGSGGSLQSPAEGSWITVRDGVEIGLSDRMAAYLDK